MDFVFDNLGVSLLFLAIVVFAIFVVMKGPRALLLMGQVLSLLLDRVTAILAKPFRRGHEDSEESD